MKRPDPRLLTLGLASLALANASHWWMLRHSAVSADLADGVYGLGMSIAIAALLLALKRGCVDRVAR